MTKRILILLLMAGSLVGCEKRTGDAVVVAKEHIDAATSSSESPSPNTDGAEEITVDSYVMRPEVRGTGRDPRALKSEQWLVNVQLVDGGRSFKVPANRSQFEKLKEGDRVHVRFRVGKYTGTVWSAEIE